MPAHEIFAAGLDTTGWSYSWRKGFDDGFEEHGYHPPRHGPERQLGPQREDYDAGFEAGAYTALDSAYPGISEATALMHVHGRSDQREIIDWLFLDADSKRRWDHEGNLAAFEFTGKTIYG